MNAQEYGQTGVGSSEKVDQNSIGNIHRICYILGTKMVSHNPAS